MNRTPSIDVVSFLQVNVLLYRTKVSYAKTKNILLNIKRYNSSSSNRWLNRQQNDVYSNQAKVENLRSRAAYKLIELDDKFKFFDKSKQQNILDLGFAPGAWSQVARVKTNRFSKIFGVDILPCQPPTGVSSIQGNILSRRTHDLIRLFFSREIKLNKIDKIHEDYGYFEDLTEKENNLYHNNPQLEGETETLCNENLPEIMKQPIDLVMSDMYVPWPQISGYWAQTTNTPYYRMANTTGVAIKDHYMSMDLCDAALVVACDLLKTNGNFICKLYTGKEDNLLEKRMKKIFNKVQRFKPKTCRDESKEIYLVGLKKKKNVDKMEVFL
ncbi:related to Ribosomal RNA methyltransferase MRM2, mitochondrial [Saccharomycodes ludwigii]|uniref:rRNA methyltransferase 2, mitochondrial n=1 Tax=Saccharomycodes ludwigii TaxID=36035 RepID=A0A376B3Q9_9ASCO|nr:hypothetical protein SCDLUD_001125 [Saccharomycodes ludwigii]KAH3903485.1 hypothetical protein SCDLUD_001125 [Saccharomycodes ludwigii]SSD59326.1 related to Ribosomal RNA methyltransferase MRM2, mitochondrial [Saccharomycodes ludwigii]